MANKPNYTLWIVLGILGLFGLIIIGSVIGSYNSLVSLEEGVDAQWANVETSYQRRFDLIPNLVETVLGAANFEKETHTQVTALRSAAVEAKANWDGAGSTADKMAAMKQIDGVVKSYSGLNINVEKYPTLKATQNFADLQVQLEGTENRISVERKRYNEAVKMFNTKVRSFPTVMVAGMFGFDKKDVFEATAGAEEAVKVDFNQN